MGWVNASVPELTVKVTSSTSLPKEFSRPQCLLSWTNIFFTYLLLYNQSYIKLLSNYQTNEQRRPEGFIDNFIRIHKPLQAPALQKGFDPVEGNGQFIYRGQANNAEVVVVDVVEPRSRHDQYFLFGQQIINEGIVAIQPELCEVDFRENVQRSLWTHTRYAGNGAHAFVGQHDLFV